jgi:hypothetical protein
MSQLESELFFDTGEIKNPKILVYVQFSSVYEKY